MSFYSFTFVYLLANNSKSKEANTLFPGLASYWAKLHDKRQGDEKIRRGKIEFTIIFVNGTS